MHVGPRSVGYRLVEEGRVFKGPQGTLTTTDVAVACGLANLGNKSHVESLPADLKQKVIDDIHKKVEDAIDQVKVSTALNF